MTAPTAALAAQVCEAIVRDAVPTVGETCFVPKHHLDALAALLGGLKALAALPASGWRPIETGMKAGRYLVASASGEVREARWMPNKQRWVFPSAQSAFTPIAYQSLPAAPAPGEPT